MTIFSPTETVPEEGSLKVLITISRAAFGDRRVKQVQEMELLVPLVVGACAIAASIIIHALALNATVRFVHRERILGRTGKHFWVDFPIVVLVISFALASHLVEIAIWAVLFMVCGEFQVFGTAYYHSAVNYTTLGYGECRDVAIMEVAESARGRRRNADVWSFNRNDFCCHTTSARV
jgi:hypothetical protein